MLIIIIRTLILYAVVVTSVRLMGKRQIGELQPSELVIAIMISDVATIPMDNLGVPLINGIIPVLTLLFAEVGLSYASMKSKKVREAVVGKPSILIRNGVIDNVEMERLRFNLDDLTEELRLNSITDIKDVDFAILETDGRLSVILKTEAQPVTIKDLNLPADKQTVPCIVIQDGKIIDNELKRSGKSVTWLKKQLRNNKVKSIDDVFLASVDSNNSLFVQLKQGGEKK